MNIRPPFTFDPPGAEKVTVYDEFLDPDNRPYVPPPVFGGATIEDRADLKARRDVVKRLEAIGFKVPKSVINALDLYGEVMNTRIQPVLPDVRGMSVQELRAAIDDYALRAAKRQHAEDAVARFTWAVSGMVESEFHAMIDPVIEHVRPEFEKAAEKFVTAHQRVRRFRSISEAATSEDPVGNVQAWTQAGEAAVRLTELSDLVLEVRREPHERSARSNVRRVHTLVTVQQVVGLRDGKQERGLHDALASPLGLWPFILAAGLPISLAEDREDWENREAGVLASTQNIKFD